MRQATAAEVRRNASAILKAPRRMPVAEAVQKFMRVPMGAGTVGPCCRSLCDRADELPRYA